MRTIAFIFCLLTNFLFEAALFAQPAKTIYVYADKGAGPESVEQTLVTFSAWLPTYTVKALDTNTLLEGTWTKHAALFVMPGGADLPYVEKLNGEGNKIIKDYVQNGGAYLGLCAGSYYAATDIEFDKDGPLKVVGSRELGFFKGKAVGPVLATYDYKSRSGSRAAKLTTHFSTLKEATVFYNGGGYFENAAQDLSVEVIATYAAKSDLAAIIFTSYGAGNVVLSGVHFEYDPNLLDPADPDLQKILPALHVGDASRKALFDKLVDRLGIQTSEDPTHV